MSSKPLAHRLPRRVRGLTIVILALISAVTLVLIVSHRGQTQHSPTSTQLQQALQELVTPLSLSPFQGSPANPQEVKIKNLPIYYVVTGLIAQPEDAARLTVGNDAKSHGWAIMSQGTTDSFLGWEMVAERNSMILKVDVGKESKGVIDSPYKVQDGFTYVQASIAGQNSGPEWAVVR